MLALARRIVGLSAIKANGPIRHNGQGPWAVIAGIGARKIEGVVAMLDGEKLNCPGTGGGLVGWAGWVSEAESVP